MFRKIFHPLLPFYPSQRFYQPLYGVCFTDMGRLHTRRALLNRLKSKAFRLINSPPLTNNHQCLKHRRNVSSLCISYCNVYGTAVLNLITACHSRSRGPAALSFLFSLNPILMQELIGIFFLSSLSMLNSGTLCLILFFHFPLR